MKFRNPTAKSIGCTVAMAAVMAIASQASAQVKISQVYGAGGNTQAPLAFDYIELYNAGAAPQDLTGWSVQYASATGVFSAAATATTALPAVVLGPGKYLLVKHGNGGTLGDETGAVAIANQVPGLPTADATNTGVAMNAGDFKVALVDGSAALLTVGTPTYAANTNLKDFVGIGPTANWNDASAAGAVQNIANNAPTSSVAHAVYRIGCGATDTDNSANNWAVGWPAPRNTATAANAGISVIGSALPLTVEELQTVVLTATPFRCGTSDLGAGTTVTVDTTSIGGGAAVPMLDGGAAPDEVANDGIYTAVVAVAAGTATGTKNLPISVSDGGGLSGGSYISILVKATTTPDNDNCTSALAVAVPSSTPANLTNATAETNSLAPATSMTSKRGLWYTVVGNGNTLTASVSATAPAFTASMIVMCGTCDGLTVISSAGANTGVTWCSAAGTTYYIWVANTTTGAQVNTFNLDITNGAACSTALPCPVCLGVPGPYTETEPGYGPHTNDGCASTPNLFTNISSPTAGPVVVRGTGRGMLGNRDIDSYRFQATSTGMINMTIDTLGANAQAQLNLLSAGGVCPQSAMVNTPIFVARCTSGLQTSVAATVTAGNWYVVNVVTGVNVAAGPTAATLFGGQMPGGTTYQYALTLAPVGACCTPSGGCTMTTSAGCVSPNSYQGDGSFCYTPSAGSPLEDITADAGATQLALGDDASSASIPLPFGFSYFGNTRNAVVINSNGWLSFDANTGITTTQMRTNAFMPSGAVVPNEFLAPYWDDLNEVAATADRISYMTRGTAPSRRFIVQWLVRIFGGSNPGCVNAELVLFEGSNCFEFRYGTIVANGTLCGTAGTASFNAGFENLAGTTGADVTSLVASNTSLRFCPQCPLPTGACCTSGGCVTDSAVNCGNAGGVYLGNDLPCTPNPCTPPGACCNGTSCTIATEGSCTAGGGIFGGDNSTCASPAPCQAPCCKSDGSCDLRTIASCNAISGAVPGALGTPCPPTPCAPLGACCLTDGSCIANVTQASCQTNALFYRWTAGASCTPNLCQGRCCAPDGTCTVTIAPNCVAPNRYGGDGSNCSPVATGVTSNYGAPTPPTVAIPTTGTGGTGGTLGLTAPSIINVPDTFPVADVNVRVKIQHTFRSDLLICLQPPSGPSIPLTSTPGCGGITGGGICAGEDNLNAIFDDEGAAVVCASVNLASLVAPPDSILPLPVSPGLAAADGISSFGDWTLNIYDDAGGDSGTLLEWELILERGVPPCQGACCILGACSNLSSDACASAGGTYAGDATDCTPSPCAPNGACCLGTGCTQQAEADCTTAGGVYGGDSSNCTSPAPCQAPCCKSDGTCDLRTIASCNALVGAVAGALGTACPAAPCAPLGACCAADGSCTAPFTEAACTATGGIRWTADANCSPNLCKGRCCAPDGTCSLTRFDQCLAPNIYGGDGTVCSPTNICSGRCCLANGTCSVTGSVGCAQISGVFSPGLDCTATTVYQFNGVNLVLEDVPAGVLSSNVQTITSPTPLIITDLNVDLTGIHTWPGDISFTLTHNGTSVIIYDRPGVPATTFGCATDNFDIVLDDEGTGGPIETVCNAAPPSAQSPPNYTPNNPLSAFDGLDAVGDWTITCADGFSGGDTGTLLSWSLHVATNAPVCPILCTCYGDMNGDAVVDGLDVAGFTACVVGGGGSCACADMDHSSAADFNDVDEFVTAALTGTCGAP